MSADRSAQSRYRLAADLDSWRDDPRIAARGFSHRWRSVVEPGNGEDAFLELLDRHLAPGCAVLDIGCGHGELAIALASRAYSVTGVDREPGYIELARELAAERGANVRFEVVDLGRAPIPCPDASVGLFVDRRGPTVAKWLADALRVARPGAVILAMHPTGSAPTPAWNDELPEPFRGVLSAFDWDAVRSWAVVPLELAGIPLAEEARYHVAEWLPSPRDLYDRLVGAGSEPPPFAEVEGELAAIFARHAAQQGLELRHQRYVWKAVLE